MSLFWYLVVTGLLVMLQQFYYVRFGLRGVEYRRGFSVSAVYEGESVEMVEVLQNRKIAPLPWVRVESRISSYLRFGHQENLDISGETFHKSIFFLRGYRLVTRRHKITCLHRGVYDLTQSFLTVGDLVGVVGKTIEVSHAARLYVYPRLLSESEMPPALRRFQGDMAVRRFIEPDPVLVAGVREYLPGDARRDIHWRATAHTGQLQVKVREYTVSPKLLVVLNVQPTEDLWTRAEETQAEAMEYGVRAAATLCAKALQDGLEVGFLCNGMLSDDKSAEVKLPALPSSLHLDAILNTMARLLLQRRSALHTMLEAEAELGLTGFDLVILTAFWNEQLEDRAVRLRKQGNTVTVAKLNV